MVSDDVRRLVTPSDDCNKEVLTVAQKFAESANSVSISDEAKKETDDMLMQANESSIPKAPWDEGVCKVCGVDKDDDNVLLCDTCDSEYHTYCLSPPLARIPEGNWYCPSCVAGQFKSQGTSHGTRVSWCRKKRYRGEFTRNFVETLSRLAKTMGSKEYWDLSVDERIFLMKFLCDETLSSSVLRDHLDHCAHMSADLQQKLRLLSSEWKNKKYREEVIASNLEKTNAVHNRVGELAPESSAFVPNKDVKLMGKLPNRGNNILCFSGNYPHLEDGPQGNGSNEYGGRHYRSFSKNKYCSSNTSLLTPSQVPQGLVSSDPISIHMVEPVPYVHVNSEHMLNGHHSSFQSDASAFEANNLEMSSLKHEISVLQESISSLESEFQKVSVRKEFLGRDSAGRVYWVFDRGITSSLMAVNRSVEVQQSTVIRHGGPTESNSNLRTSQHGMENPSSSRGAEVSSVYEYAQKNGVATSTWVSYQSDTGIGELIGWLSDGDARERELKESILLWKINKEKRSNNAENHIQKEEQLSCLKPSDGGKVPDSNFLASKAGTVLEKKYGPWLGSKATDISKKGGQKGKVTCDARMYRCECLEPIWPFRHHCLLCHQTYSTSEELERHNDGMCSAPSVITKNKRVNEDSLKGKRMATETSVKKHPDNNGIDRATKSEKNEIHCNVNKLQEPECPYDFEEISAKFVTQTSLKELVRDVGLIGSSGIPTFVPSESPYLSDPTLRLGPARKNEVDSGNELTEVENQLSIKGATIAGVMEWDSGSDYFPKYVENDRDEEASKAERLIFNSTNERGQLSSIKNKKPADGVGKCCVIPESSTRRIVGRVSQILSQLKINLIDMDAALPEEALRPSMAHLEKRSAWRAFVKSAGSIYEMVQATIVLENMIKADYLKKDWWSWSSLSAAANISTLSALALRVYTLDTAIIFETPSPTSDSSEILKPSVAEGERTPSKLDTTNTKPNSPIIQKAANDPSDCSKPKSRLNKRRKDSGG
ncbi:hypothetical protein U1Q18_017056 [Sarracenia purpurea var. burkii]